ncbi:hypothetical protein BU26DRAFT_517286 [Trematosphaeria pertusa]|uniref:Ig-like domain-containing protein n=1 Tax=Trematosphaeria pertusa TaxID=390896 RepID=A0A6A6IT54_9PLEO|nr:uncharacterized protein BU26DRAFT_517286 [Trematosphaeria pertusa]KAF2252713.1 hypothetical protein BU26DRAFT_517286 [Trematosphaeria pertusa]
MNTFQLFCALCSLSHGVFGVAIPGQFTQAPLPPSKPDTKTSVPFYATKAILAVTAVGDEDEKYIELPLRQRMPPGPEFPYRLDGARIVALMNEQRQSAPLEELGLIMCRIMPRDAVEEEVSSTSRNREWPWFRAKDGAVQFQQASSVWFLADRDIESYECR